MTFAMFTSLRVWDKKKAVTAAFLSGESQVDLWFELQISYENIGDGNEASLPNCFGEGEEWFPHSHEINPFTSQGEGLFG